LIFLLYTLGEILEIPHTEPFDCSCFTADEIHRTRVSHACLAVCIDDDTYYKPVFPWEA
jgi:hypothetical protein